MDKFDRIFQLHAILSSRRTAIPLEDLMAKLECSKSTLHRAINALKDYLHAPVAFDTKVGGYRYVKDTQGSAYELPGLWFTPNELQALAALQGLLHGIGSGLLQEQVGAITKRLDELTKHQHLNLGEAASRLRYPQIASRPPGEAFQSVAAATLQRKKLWMEYHARTDDQRSERTISPQRVIHYRETWYLDAWDHDRNALRTFSIDRITHPTPLNEMAFDIPEDELDEHYASAYGIFGGKADKVAVLKFSSERARWVADESWHPAQDGRRLEDGTYELRIPYHDSRELLMDILRHGASVEVLQPDDLRRQIAKELQAMQKVYASELVAPFDTGA